MQKTVIKNGLVLKKTENGYITEQADISVIGNTISLETDALIDDDTQIVDAKDKLIIPGLINLHTHFYMTAMRNFADDLAFDDWLFGKIMPAEDKLSHEFAYYSCLLGAMEMIGTGTTCFMDMHMFKGQSCKAVEQSGMRAFIGRCVVGDDLYAHRFNEALEEMAEYESDRIKFVLSPHAIYSCSTKLLQQVRDEAKKRNMLKQIHASESANEIKNSIKDFGKRPIEYLADMGFLDDKTLLAHCVRVNDGEMDIIKAKGSSVVTNPASNMKLGNGFAPVPTMLNKGINVCLGTDSAASNNTLNMFREMGIYSLIHKGVNEDSTLLPSHTVIDTATVNPAKAVKMEGKLGEIKDGAIADLVLLDLNKISLFPHNNIVSSLSNSANGSEVSSVMIDGKWVMRNNEYLTIDKEKVLYEVDRLANKFLR
ncbi:MAG: amidohydrolase [Clostridia bacterium]|nr:amidohydrolase [Clostridia bacterium]MBQ9977743.1 amidohydrolase [Clostridia bacterium]